MLFAGDFVDHPDVEEATQAQIDRQLDAVKQFKDWPCAIKVAISGNHDHLLEEGFAEIDPIPLVAGAARQRLTTEQKEVLRAAYRSRPEDGWYFSQAWHAGGECSRTSAPHFHLCLESYQRLSYEGSRRSHVIRWH